MKKFLSIILSLAMVTTTETVAFAANGDVIGNIYSTDIRAYINGVEVESYNIGGRTAVVIEDILDEKSHQYVYDDKTRSLKFFSLNPQWLVEKKSDDNPKSGRIIGKIYETDIKTSVYDVVIPTYNIGGKTAVVIEALGYNGEFSPIGGKYIWNDADRTISLEFLYENYSNISGDRNIRISANDTMTEAVATFEETVHCDGGREHFSFPEYVTDDAEIEAVMPVKSGDEIIGYYFRRPLKDNKFTAFVYYYPEMVKEAEKVFIPNPDKTRESIISHFVNNHSVGEPRERFDTDDYTFIYISVAGTSWTSYNLVQVYDDGTFIDYSDEIHMQNRSPANLVIDKDNEKVTFKHVDRYTSEWFTNYEIDLKEGKISECKSLETDIGIGKSDGQPPEGEITTSRSGQYEYKLIAGEKEKAVEGFVVQEYYYADMLPLAETFDFLNIKYTFENDILNIDSSEAVAFQVENTGKRADVLGENAIDYLHIDKVLLNGEEVQITYPYISGHFDKVNNGRAEAKPYVCGGKVYINSSFITWLYERQGDI